MAILWLKSCHIETIEFVPSRSANKKPGNSTQEGALSRKEYRLLLAQ